jgi:ATP-dependent Zn protease
MDDGQTNKYKNFRYSCFKTPASAETALNYLSREGRFPKNWQNFYPNNSNVCCSNDINSPFWGPDASYENNAYGLSSNATFNPSQSTDYMRANMRNWLIWYKKQVGWDGVRLDAVKHFPSYAAEDFLWILQYNALFASGGADMFGKSTAKLFKPDETNKVSFSDVAGCDNEKYELQEVIDFLKNPEKFTKLGSKIPKGILLSGSPGVGKTLLSRAVANEAQVPFYYISASEFIQMFVGLYGHLFPA